MSSSRGLPAPLQPQLQHQISSPIAVVPSPDVPVVAAPLERQALWRGAEVHSLEGWDEAKREDAQVRNGEAPRESYLSVAGQTLGKWIWGGLRLVPAASSGSAWLRDDKTAIATTSQTRPYNAASSSSSSFSSSPSPSSSTPPARPPFAQQAVFPRCAQELAAPIQRSSLNASRSTTILGEETSMHRQDESLEINWLNGQGRPSVEGSARDEEGALGEEEEGGSQLRTLFASVRNRSRELMGRIENWGLNTKNGDGPIPPPLKAKEIASHQSSIHRVSTADSCRGRGAGDSTWAPKRRVYLEETETINRGGLDLDQLSSTAASTHRRTVCRDGLTVSFFLCSFSFNLQNAIGSWQKRKNASAAWMKNWRGEFRCRRMRKRNARHVKTRLRKGLSKGTLSLREVLLLTLIHRESGGD